VTDPIPPSAMEERWAPVGDRHIISSCGRLACVLVGQLNTKTGYREATIQCGGKDIRKSLHRMVLTAFAGPPPSQEHQCAHLNGKRADNRIENLKWATCEENASHKKGHGTHLAGDDAPWSKLTEQDVLDIRTRHSKGLSTVALAGEYGISRSSISLIVRGINWAHVGGPIKARSEP
jgi:hypothetical protein